MGIEKVDSMDFNNAIMKCVFVELPGDDEEMIIEEGFGNDYFGNMVIENDLIVKKIVVKKNSLKNLNFLKIWNNEKMKSIEIEDCSFYNVKNVMIESM